jgi:hypothetical protein
MRGAHWKAEEVAQLRALGGRAPLAEIALRLGPSPAPDWAWRLAAASCGPTTGASGRRTGPRAVPASWSPCPPPPDRRGRPMRQTIPVIDDEAPEPCALAPRTPTG